MPAKGITHIKMVNLAARQNEIGQSQSIYAQHNTAQQASGMMQAIRTGFHTPAA